MGVVSSSLAELIKGLEESVTGDTAGITGEFKDMEAVD